jgi:hypothetical protein
MLCRPFRSRPKSSSRFPVIEPSGSSFSPFASFAVFFASLREISGRVHLDVAGAAWLDEGKPFLAKGPTGVPFRTMVRPGEGLARVTAEASLAKTQREPQRPQRKPERAGANAFCHVLQHSACAAFRRATAATLPNLLCSR